MDDTSEKKLRALKLKLAIAEKELQAAAGKWKLGGFLGAGHANAMNREVDKVRTRLNQKIEKIKSQIAEFSGGGPASEKDEVKSAPAPKKSATPKTAEKTESPKTEQASVKKPAQKSTKKK